MMKAKGYYLLTVVLLIFAMCLSVAGCEFSRKVDVDIPDVSVSQSDDNSETAVNSGSEAVSASASASASEGSAEGSDSGENHDPDPGDPDPDRQLRILFLGNSLVFYNDMPVIFETIAKCAGKNVYVASITQGSSTMTKFADRSTDIGEQAYIALTTRQWDYVIIEPSRRITPYENTVMNAELAAAKRLQELATGAGAEILLYNVWGQNTGIMTIYQAEEGTAQTHSVGSKKVTRQGHAKWMHDVAERVSASLGGVKILPAGYAFENFLALYSDVNLYVSDNAHPSFEGSYLAACTIFATIFNERVSSYPATHVANRGAEIRAVADQTAIDGVVPDITFVPEEAADENSYKVLVLGSDLMTNYDMGVAFAEIMKEVKGGEVYCEYLKSSTFTFRNLIDENADLGLRYALESFDWDAIVMQITRRVTRSSKDVEASEKAALASVIDIIKANTENVFLFTLQSDSNPAIFAVDQNTGDYYKTDKKESYTSAEGSAYYEELAAAWAKDFEIGYIPYGTAYTDYSNSGTAKTQDGLQYLRACCLYDSFFGEAVPDDLTYINGLDSGLAAMLRSYAKRRCLGEDIPEQATEFNVLVIGSMYMSHNNIDTVLNGITLEADNVQTNVTFIRDDKFTFIQLATEGSVTDLALAEVIGEKTWDAVILQLTRRMTRSDLSVEAGEKAALEQIINGKLKDYKDKIYLFTLNGTAGPTIYSVEDGVYKNTGNKEPAEISTIEYNAAYYAEVACAWAKEFNLKTILYGSTYSSDLTSAEIGYLKACCAYMSLFGEEVPETLYLNGIAAEKAAELRALAKTYCLGEYIPPLLYSEEYSSDDVTHWFNCISVGHRGEKGNEAEHAYGDGEVTLAPTEDAEGTLTFTCSVCGHKHDQPIAKLTFAEEWSHDETNHWHACTTEGYEEVASALAAHTWDDGEVVLEPTYEEDGTMRHTCTVCDATKDVSIDKLNMPELVYSEEWSKDETHHWHQCVTEGFTDRIADKAEHNIVESARTEATWFEDGEIVYTCSVCGHTQKEAIARKTTFNLLVIGTAIVDDQDFGAVLNTITTSAYGLTVNYDYIVSGTFTFIQLATADSATNKPLVTKLAEKEYDAIILQVTRRATRSELSLEQGEFAALESLLDNELKGYADKIYLYTLEGSANPTIYSVVNGAHVNTNLKETSTPEQNTQYYAEIAHSWAQTIGGHKILYGNARNIAATTISTQLGYLQACCVFNSIFQREIDENAYPEALTAETAAQLRALAKTYCLGEYIPPLIYSDEYSSDDMTHWFSCISVGHRGEKGNEAEHAYGDGEVTLAPTEDAEGTLTFTCSVCGHKHDQPIAKLTFAEEWSHDDTNHWHACTTEGYEEVTSALAAHVWNDGEVVLEPTYEEDGTMRHTCTVCGATKDVIIDKLGAPELVYSEEWSKDQTNHWHQCVTEGYTDRTADKAEHAYTSAVKTKPTAFAAGAMLYTCSVCGHTYEEEIAKNETYNLLVIGTSGAINSDDSSNDSLKNFLTKIMKTDGGVTLNFVYLTASSMSFADLNDENSDFHKGLVEKLASTWWDAIVLQVAENVTALNSEAELAERTQLAALLPVLEAKSSKVVLYSLKLAAKADNTAQSEVIKDWSTTFGIGYYDYGAAGYEYGSGTARGHAYLKACGLYFLLVDDTITESCGISSSSVTKVQGIAKKYYSK